MVSVCHLGLTINLKLETIERRISGTGRKRIYSFRNMAVLFGCEFKRVVMKLGLQHNLERNYISQKSNKRSNYGAGWSALD